MIVKPRFLTGQGAVQPQVCAYQTSHLTPKARPEYAVSMKTLTNDSIVEHVAQQMGLAGTLSNEQAFALSIVEHVVGSSVYICVPQSRNFTSLLIDVLGTEDFLICGAIFKKLEQAGLVQRTPVWTEKSLHQTLNICKKHCALEWETPNVGVSQDMNGSDLSLT